MDALKFWLLRFSLKNSIINNLRMAALSIYVNIVCIKTMENKFVKAFYLNEDIQA